MPLYQAAGLLLIRSDGKFLLQHRDAKAPRFPLYWGFFGGGINKNETPKQAMLREIKEELNIDVIDYNLALKYDSTDDSGIQEKRWIFTAPFEKQRTLTLNEGQGMGWFSVKDLENIKIVLHNKKAIEKIVKMTKPYPLH